ncbi:hypothetical protein, conserved [Babesia bigemina]|uniref:C3H1-type domain-containing protein n=1 Tax=Babesia bigemina TaxID=5866 RepID=A0A061BKJ4_BABBI|nr:hypothetical protein, conserved [Babesia bigemina]CDR71990.1 hypothetical protein, conserved [Babesia bigemina]|eukprot:XP_012770931.1 hypothetical protein, conserved [Babesia bigemina]
MYNADKDVAAEVEKHIPGTGKNDIQINGRDGLMNAFKGAYDGLSGKLGKSAFESDVYGKLNAAIGDDHTTNSVSLKAGVFLNYERQITQSSLSGPLDKLGGTLPRKIRDIETKVTGALNNNGTEFITATVLSDALLAVYTRLSEFTGAVKDLVEKSDGGKNNSLSYHLAKLGAMVGDDNGIYPDEVDKLTDIYSNLEALQKRVSQVTSNTNARYMNSIINDLESLPKKVDNARQNALQKMEVLRSKIKTKVRAISEAVELADGALQDAIKALRETSKTAKTSLVKAVSELKTTLLTKAESAFTVVTTHVRKMYAIQHKSDLEALRSLVSTQISAIDHIIDEDRASGIKCLLWYMNQNHKTLTELTGVQESKWTADKIRHYLHPLFTYITSQLTPTPSSQLVAGLQARTHALLSHLHDNKRTFTFDSGFRSLLHDLTSTLSSFDPATFANPHHPQLLDALKAGMQGLVKEMEKAYVNRYCGSKGITWEEVKGGKQETAADATRCAKVFMSCLPMWVEDLGELKRRCEGSWSKKAIHLKDEIDKENPLGEFLKQCGYIVPTSQKSHQDGELQCRHTFTGKHIDGILGKIIQMSNLEHVPQCRSREKEWNFNIMDFIACLYSHLDEYNEVCHLSTLFSKRHPCSIYEILCWFSGLPHSTVYSALPGGITKLLDKPKKQAIDSGDSGIEIEFDDENAYYLDAHPHKFTYKDIYAVIELICSKSYDVLARIAGTGDEHTRYACEYANNSLKLHYPKTADDCLPMLVDMLRRLLSVFRFLESKCSYSAMEFGWADCQYGKNVPTTKSHCNDRSTEEVTCQAKCQPKCRPNSQPNSQPNCQPTSPLMSYLNDCLPGHLPHQLTNVGCKSECKTCPGNKPGMPCLTPLGFRGFSGSIKTGEQLCRIIKEILGNGIIACLFTLAPRPPTNLPEHFQFAVSLAKGLSASKQSKVDGIKTLADTIANSINASSIKLYENTDELTTPMCKAYGNTPTEHRSPNRTNNKLNLSCISLTNSCITQEHCVPYLSPLSCDTYHYLVNKQSNSYLSWAVYLPWTFHKYLASLLDAFKAIRCEDWGCRNCLHTDICKGESHGMLNPAEKGTGCQCTSVVHCNGVSPTLYQYGFTFRDAQNLISLKRNCFNMRSHLYNVVNSDYFTDLFKQCDMLLWRIREPFSYLVLALWLLSVLYLLHIMVIRLDLLHIKSHLHSPSSHRIAAQSLLAAARVNKLGKVFYLQP